MFFILTLLLFRPSNCNPNGAPVSACGTLSPDPDSHGALPQVSESPFGFRMRKRESGHSVMDSYEVVIEGEEGRSFKGFIIQCQDGMGNVFG